MTGVSQCRPHTSGGREPVLRGGRRVWADQVRGRPLPALLGVPHTSCSLGNGRASDSCPSCGHRTFTASPGAPTIFECASPECPAQRSGQGTVPTAASPGSVWPQVLGELDQHHQPVQAPVHQPQRQRHLHERDLPEWRGQHLSGRPLQGERGPAACCWLASACRLTSASSHRRMPCRLPALQHRLVICRPAGTHSRHASPSAACGSISGADTSPERGAGLHPLLRVCAGADPHRAAL